MMVFRVGVKTNGCCLFLLEVLWAFSFGTMTCWGHKLKTPVVFRDILKFKVMQLDIL